MHPFERTISIIVPFVLAIMVLTIFFQTEALIGNHHSFDMAIL